MYRKFIIIILAIGQLTHSFAAHNVGQPRTYLSIRSGYVSEQTHIYTPKQGDAAYNIIPGGKYHSNSATFKIAAGATTSDGDIELEISYLVPSNINKNINILSHTISASLGTYIFTALYNGYLAIDLPDKFRYIRPIIGAGIGTAIIHERGTVEIVGPEYIPASNHNDDKTHIGFIWAIGAGTQFEISDHIVIEGLYRYTDMGKIKKVANIDKLSRHFYTHELLLGARYIF